MKKDLSSYVCKEPHRSIIFLSCLITSRALLQISLNKQGFISVAADEFARGILAARWAKNPQINILEDIQGVWLPLEKYLNGIFLILWPDEIITPRVAVFIFSCLLLIAIYLLVYNLYRSFFSAILSVLLISFLPWYVWLSGTPMLEIYYLFGFFSGLYFLLNWLQEDRYNGWLWSGVCFLFASGFHVQSWIIINLVNLFLLPWLIRFIKQKNNKNFVKLISYFLISNGLIICFILIEFILTGKAFAIFLKHTSYSKWVYEGYNISILDKFLYYPKLIINNSSEVVWLSLLIALIFIRYRQKSRWELYILFLSLITLLINSLFNIISVPATAAPGRYSLFYSLIFMIYVAYGIDNLFTWGWKQPNEMIKIPAVILSIILLLYSLWWGIEGIPEYPRGMPSGPIEAGRRLNQLLNKNPGTYMVQLHYWEYLAINLTSGNYDTIMFDREQDIYNKNTPSLFREDPITACNILLEIKNLRYVLLKDEALKSQAQQIYILNKYQDIGSWTIYEVLSDSAPINTCN